MGAERILEFHAVTRIIRCQPGGSSSPQSGLYHSYHDSGRRSRPDEKEPRRNPPQRPSAHRNNVAPGAGRFLLWNQPALPLIRFCRETDEDLSEDRAHMRSRSDLHRVSSVSQLSKVRWCDVNFFDDVRRSAQLARAPTLFAERLLAQCVTLSII